MKELFISHNAWKEVYESNNWVGYFVELDEGYEVLTGHKDLIFRSVVSSDNISDFKFNVKSLLVKASSINDAIALLIGLTTQALKVTPSGAMLSAPTHMTVSEAWRMHGYKFNMPASGLSIHDIEITTQVLVQGGTFWVDVEGEDDYAEFSVVDKNNVLGLFSLFGLTPGEDVLELKKFITKMYMHKGFNNKSIMASVVTPVVSGLFLRNYYYNSSSSPVKVGMSYVWYET
jgi:hypothetical protein